MSKQLKEYISVGDAAEYYGKTTQSIYNMIKANMVNAVQFTRGTMIGWLVEKPADYDAWKQGVSTHN